MTSVLFLILVGAWIACCIGLISIVIWEDLLK